MEQTTGKVILVTGGAQGLGKAISHTLAELSGATLLIADIQQEKAEAVAAGIRQEGKKAVSVKLNLCNEKSIDDAVILVREQFGRLDVLVNNAGVDVTKPITEMSVAEWDSVINVNLRGPFLMAKAFLPMMAEQGSGHIINIISTAALRGWTEASAYHASKWGLRGFTQALFTEARRSGIKVSAVIAGGMKTPFLLDRFPDLDQSKLQDPANVARTIRFLLSQPPETVIPEVMVLPLQETSWP
ncbi:SDR family oxidoreductase [Compostibacter hankyongensis]|uniref:SDR family oxidoreductase n=1 Tax=Compostibacter hankyongensis TaxID=1007089 RepID=A0ABP8FW29_9BACT